MQNGALRLVALSLLLVFGGFAAYVAWTTEQGIQHLDEQRATKAATIDRLLTSITAITAAQQAAVDYGRQDQALFTRLSRLIDRITTDAAGLRAGGAAPAASGARLEEFWTALSALMSAESRARESLAGGDDAATADAVSAYARDRVSMLDASLRAFRDSEEESYRRARGEANRRIWTAISAAGSMWAVGLVLFAVIPPRRTVPATVPSETTLANESAVAAALAPVPPRPEPAMVASVATIDMPATADLSLDLARLDDPESLSGLLGRAAAILDARGIIVWLAAENELYAAAAHGYDRQVLQRIRPIERTADNATAAAWRRSELRTVTADEGSYGAIVAPMVGPSGCVGALAAEVRGGRESDAAARSVAQIIASQLASVLAARSAERVVADGQSDRTAAAS